MAEFKSYPPTSLEFCFVSFAPAIVWGEERGECSAF